MKPLTESEFTIVGAGLMGASLALSLRGKVKKVTGVERDAVHRATAEALFDDITDDLDGAAAGSDVIVLATPIRVILKLIERLAPCLRPGTLIIDLGSTKRQVVAAMDALPASIAAIGGHPMCGKETSGPEAADGGLFGGRVFVLCPSTRTTPEALDFAESMIQSIGAHRLILPAERHDAAVAVISHLPYLLSAGLVGTAIQQGANDAILWKIASSGFRDTSRLAGSDLTMMSDILLTNREAVLDALRIFDAQLHGLEKIIESSDENALRGILGSARQARIEWSNKAPE